MSVIQRCVVPLTLLCALSAVGCKDTPTNATPDSASAAALQKTRTAPLPTQIRIDPLVAKVYRAEACYYGTLSLRSARAAYLGSLGGGEPSATKLPDFGSPSVDVPLGNKAPPGTPAASVPVVASGAPHATAVPSAKPTPPPAPPKPLASAASSAKPAASGASVATTGASSDAKQMGLERRLRSIPYDRFARSCTVAAGIKVPEAPDLDATMAEYAPFAVELAKNLSLANTYYQKEDYKSDDFAKGKELHGKIVDGFKKLDDMQKKVGAALADFKQKTPYDQQAWSDPQKSSFILLDAARDVYLDLQADKVDVAKTKADIEKLDQLNAALKKWGDDHKDANPNDPFVRIVTPATDVLVKESQDIISKIDAKGPLPTDMVALATYFTRVLEGNNRAVARSMADKDGAGMAGDRIHRVPDGHPALGAPPAPPPSAPPQQ